MRLSRSGSWIARVSLLLLLVIGAVRQGPVRPAAASGPSYQITWQEGSNFQIVEFWNAPGRRDCDYAANSWPQAQFAAERALVLAARSVMRDEWDVDSWIAGHRASSSQARIHGAESNCPNGHIDYPPHVHIFYRTINSNGEWAQINSHHYPDAQGNIYDNFVIPNLCGQTASYHQPAGEWLDMLDETCGVAWQQRYTASGDLELRRSTSSATYTLRARDIGGDLAGADVVRNGQVLYSVDVTEYDPAGFRMAAEIQDFQRGDLITEQWVGDPSNAGAIKTHATSVAPLGGGQATSTPAPTATRLPSPTRTPRPTSTPSPILRTFLPMLER